MGEISRKTNTLMEFLLLSQNPRDSREMRESDRAIKENDVPLLRESTGITGSTKPISIPLNEPGEPGRPQDTRGNARGSDRSDAGGQAGVRMEAKCL